MAAAVDGEPEEQLNYRGKEKLRIEVKEMFKYSSNSALHSVRSYSSLLAHSGAEKLMKTPE